MDKIITYFPGLTESQISCFQQLLPLYQEWNEKINVISRKDIDHLYERHVLHSLAISKVINFVSGTKVVDIGTGGGFPGIPLAILFPEVQFHLVDSIGKKINVVNEIVAAIGLQNVTTKKNRAEDLTGSYDFVVSRAVASLPQFYKWVRHLISKDQKNKLPNGVLYIKGGDISVELISTYSKKTIYPISKYFVEDFFQTKKIVHLFS